MDCFPVVCDDADLTISLKKTVVKYEPTSSKTCTPISIYINGKKLEGVDIFVYLRRTLLRDEIFDEEVNAQIAKASDA